MLNPTNIVPSSLTTHVERKNRDWRSGGAWRKVFNFVVDIIFKGIKKYQKISKMSQTQIC